MDDGDTSLEEASTPAADVDGITYIPGIYVRGPVRDVPDSEVGHTPTSLGYDDDDCEHTSVSEQ